MSGTVTMARRNLNDLLAFVTVAREGSFTRAAATLGVTQSAISQAIRGLEERIGVRLQPDQLADIDERPKHDRPDQGDQRADPPEQ